MTISNHGNSRLLLIAAIFTAALTLFVLEPYCAKVLLPVFGGSSAVWATSLFCFQLLLLCGYGASHLLVSRLAPGKHFKVLLAPLAAAAVILFAAPPLAMARETPLVSPQLAVMWLLLSHIGVPFTLLSMASPLLQAWHSRLYPDRSPYPLYALSNIGSLAGLLCYPFIIEPLFSLDGQQSLLRVLFLVFGLLLCAGGLAVRQINSITPALKAEPVEHGWQAAGWFAYSTCGATLLVAFTNHICNDIASIPLLWVAPLALYLITFIICFAAAYRHYRPQLAIGCAALLCILPLQEISGIGASVSLSVPFCLATLFVCCLLCHGELAISRPPSRALTRYYFIISLGGAAGGLFGGVLAPVIFKSYAELPLALGALALLALSAHVRAQTAVRTGLSRFAPYLLAALVLIRLVPLFDRWPQTIHQERNFYGLLRVLEWGPEVTGSEFTHKMLMHGRLIHSFEIKKDPAEAPMAAMYLSKNSGIGRVLSYEDGANRRVGLIGLGAGVLLAYGNAGDIFHYYELDPVVVDIARDYFSFISKTTAEFRITVGDGRLMLAREAPQQFDILVLDAFNGASVPVHLLTEEAFAVWLRHIRPGGVLTANIRNLHFDFEPLFAAVAKRHGWHGGIAVTKVRNDLETPSRQVIMSQDPKWLEVSGARPFKQEQFVWTDHYINPFPLLRPGIEE